MFGIDTIFYIALALSLVGSGLGAYSSYQSGQKQEKAANANAKAQMDAAANEQATAAENAKRQREENQRRLASIKAKMGASGVQSGAGSSLDILGESANELELQTLDLFRDAENRSRRYTTEAALNVWQGEQAASAGAIGATGSLISGFGSAVGSYGTAKMYRTSKY